MIGPKHERVEAAVERAAIYEYDGGLSRVGAELKAAKEYGVNVREIENWKGYAKR